LQSQTTENLQVKFVVQRIGLITLALLLMVFLVLLGIHQLQMSDPYVQQVISLTGDVDRGHAIFQMNCAGCHGLEARGRVGPSLRGISGHKSQLNLIHQITSGQTPPMPKFKASPEDMADLLSYLETL
jgi:mono/diheme cytochrome c family protein